MKTKFTKAQKEKIIRLMKKWKFYDWIIKDGIDGQLKTWKSFVKICENGYDSTLDEYLNDLTIRDRIENIIDAMHKDCDFINNIETFIKPFDKKFKELLIETDKCVWGKQNENEFSNKKKFWWYWGIVKNAKGELLEDLNQLSEFEYYKNREKN